MNLKPDLNKMSAWLKRLTCVCIGVVAAEGNAQNLVPNPSFEVYTFCPPALGTPGPMPCPPWVSINGLTADYFNACADPMYSGVPVNFQGAQPAHTGVAYTGAYYHSFSNASHEFVQAPLISPMDTDKCYRVGVWLSLADEACGADRVGILLTPNAVVYPVGVYPQVDWFSEYFSDKEAWMYIFDYVQATGTEKYITIGNFYTNAETHEDPACYGPPSFSYYYIDDVEVVEVPIEQAEIELGGPYVACDSFIIDPGDPSVVYHWADGHEGPTWTVYASGTYSVTVSYGCTTAEDEVEVTIIQQQDFDMGPPAVTLCDGDSYDIELDPALETFYWNDGSEGPDYTITDAGVYMVTLDDGCHLTSDTIVVSLLSPPMPFSLGNDTFLCPGDIITLSLNPALGDFQWQDNSADPVYQIDQEGSYALTISNMCGQESDDLEVIEVEPPLVELGPDTVVLCDLNIFEVDLDPDMGAYQWQDGSTNPFYAIDTAGVFAVTVTNGCGVATDLMVADQQTTPAFTFGPDLAACPGDTFILAAPGNEGAFLWQDGSSGQTLTVTASGQYTLSISNACGSATDTMDVSYASFILPPDLGPDLTLCPGDQWLLMASSTGAYYSWNDMSTADTLLVTMPGTYYVQVYNACASYSDTILISLNSDPPAINLPPDFALCQGQSYPLSAGISGVSFSWSDGSTQPELTVTSPGTYSLTVSNACGTDADTVLVSAGEPLPTASLGPDTSLCAGEIIVIHPLTTDVTTWIWQDGSTLPEFTASMPGTIILLASNTCGETADTLIISQLPAIPVLNLSADTALCPGDQVTLMITIPDVSVQWNNGSTGLSQAVYGGETVWATISNDCGSSSDTMAVALLPGVPSVELGPDQTICPGESVELSAQTTYVESYIWQDGSMDTTFQATQGGWIVLTGSNACGAATDSMYIQETTDGPQLDLGPDQSACEGGTILLTAGISGVEYLWQDGSMTDRFLVNVSGAYSLTVSNACGMDTDTVLVDISGIPPSVELGPDTTLCEHTTLLLTVEADPSTTVTWQDQTTGPVYVVNAPGLYTARAVNACGADEDSLRVYYLLAPEPFNLGKDTILCLGQSITLVAPSDTFDIRWQDGSSGVQMIAGQTGTYSLALSNRCGTASDSLRITVDDAQPALDLGADLVWCAGDTFTLDATQSIPSTYLWNTGEQSPVILVYHPGPYGVEVTTPCFSATDDAVVIPYDDCPDGPVIYVPNVFSPNGDGSNDLFIVSSDDPSLILGMTGFIFDRWGNMIHHSLDNPFTWNGFFHEEKMMPGVYVYVIEVEYLGLNGLSRKTLIGDVTLVR